MSYRSDELLTIATAYSEAHNEWVEADNRPNPDASYWDAVEALLDAMDAGDIPSDCRRLAVAVDALRQELVAFDARDRQDDPMPGNAFWAAVQGVQGALEDGPARQSRPPLETMQQLRDQKVADWQIALIYGLVPKHHRDRPNQYAHLVQKEIDRPGSVIGTDWIDPRDRDEDDTAKKTDKNYRALLERKQAAAADPDCPETIEELLLQGVSHQQIAKMHRCTVADVAEEEDRLAASGSAPEGQEEPKRGRKRKQEEVAAAA